MFGYKLPTALSSELTKKISISNEHRVLKQTRAKYCILAKTFLTNTIMASQIYLYQAMCNKKACNYRHHEFSDFL